MGLDWSTVLVAEDTLLVLWILMSNVSVNECVVIRYAGRHDVQNVKVPVMVSGRRESIQTFAFGHFVVVSMGD